MTTLGQLLRAARENRGLTQRDVAATIGGDDSSISRYEGGSAVPSLAVFRRLCRLYAADPADLLNLNGKDEWL